MRFGHTQLDPTLGVPKPTPRSYRVPKGPHGSKAVVLEVHPVSRVVGYGRPEPLLTTRRRNGLPFSREGPRLETDPASGRAVPGEPLHTPSGPFCCWSFLWSVPEREGRDGDGQRRAPRASCRSSPGYSEEGVGETHGLEGVGASPLLLGSHSLVPETSILLI